jgi:signal-transduction protein with cAMP-binding, CBS, and nucleotidyltransferase domain
MMLYHDEEMEQRRRFIQNIPFFTDIEDQDLVSDIMYLMKQETFSMKQIILKRGIHNENIMIIWEGAIEVIVNRNDPKTNERKSIWFENINRGTCFNVYCAFTDRMT